ncbi:uncharacterized protein TNCV_2027561 [Trichonephila clavipes]|nr:uncharacterized protein TNCV_2027561 [Trichonephila clavipes]
MVMVSGLTVPKDAKRVDLRRLIEESDVYKEDYEFVKTVIEKVLEETKAPEFKHNGQLELERLKLERVEAELELAQLRTNTSNRETSFNGGETGTSIDVFIKSVRTLTIKVPSKSEGRGFILTYLETAYSNKFVPEMFRAEILSNLLGEIETHVQFASRLTTNFEYYLKLRKVTDFDTLKDFIVSDKMLQALDRETAAHITIRQSEDWFRPLQLGKECDLHFTSSGLICGSEELNSSLKNFWEIEEKNIESPKNLENSIY